MKVYVLFVYLQNRFDGIYGSYKTEKAALVALEEIEEQGFRGVIQVLMPK